MAKSPSQKRPSKAKKPSAGGTSAATSKSKVKQAAAPKSAVAPKKAAASKSAAPPAPATAPKSAAPKKAAASKSAAPRSATGPIKPTPATPPAPATKPTPVTPPKPATGPTPPKRASSARVAVPPDAEPDTSRSPVLEAEPVFADAPEAGRKSPKALPSGEPSGRVLPFEIDPKRMEEGLRKLQGEMVHWANKGRYTRVRFKFRGKQLLPDLPLAAVVAAEGLTFYWGGILRVLIANVVGGSVFQVELVNDSEKRIQAGKEALLSGDVDQALALFREAVAMDRDQPSAHLNVGVALKLQGDRAGALAAFEKAKELDPEGPVGAEAERLAAPLRPQG
ncbi:tetratricopeptide repeat protein [Comamonas sp. JC664]|uniref:tetratricopeptide repeat protein n=1 Tax=Comamonas sp. JC664 TaxID=2801917 RepID=UPI00191E870A|nr:tetratricopeptide repeat protein [Comamonas sp. JC664]MBL0695464.1 tetratricopeptide repeat protein [Comamonas sp. JC664]